MSFYRRNKKNIRLIIFFTLVKVTLHFIANNNYGFHRDELLYKALGEHVDWGFKEVPPFVAGLSWITTHLFGDSLFATRLFSTLFGAAIVFLTGLIVLNLGGKRLAIIIACTAVIVSPSFLASQYLFQPVVFDQFFWTLTAYFFIRYIRTREAVNIYYSGISIGFGMLNKYSMAFFALALIVALMISAQRKLLVNRAWLIGALIAFLIFLPNLLWQINNGLPVFRHMKELRGTQLNYISPVDFGLQQLLIHASVLFIWLPGLVYLFLSRTNRQYRFLGIAFFLTLIMLIVLKGKVYYSFGAYPMLFAAGGIAFYKLMKNLKPVLNYTILAFIFIPSFLFLPIVIPILPLANTLKFFKFSAEKLNLKFALKWEDQKEHATTQDYADMLGWNEIAENVTKAYKTIPADDKDSSTIFANNYGQAGAIDHYRKKYQLPAAVCLSSSYALWSPASFPVKHIVYVDDEYPDTLGTFYKSVVKIGEVENQFAREKGTAIYLLSYPVKDIMPIYQAQRKLMFD
ncbi:glycosyltransferase family 39 protein [Daejeonella oryzae]|uniref:glycosyltransferase family 39 protein n=1 Tax=Daejeonella oryzae TaxID=1122943 RepID=UPI000425F8F2|nr:glycosyltransferase family 39 protein [Daejeonella oryzae]